MDEKMDEKMEENGSTHTHTVEPPLDIDAIEARAAASNVGSVSREARETFRDCALGASRTWLGAFVRVRDEAGDEWHAAVVSSWVTKRTRRLTRVVLRWGAGAARRDYRRRVLRVEACDDGNGARCVLVIGGTW